MGAGRNFTETVIRDAILLFQSSPGMGAGRNAELPEYLVDQTYVSILARHGSRAQQGKKDRTVPIDPVSILARHGSRAQQVIKMVLVSK